MAAFMALAMFALALTPPLSAQDAGAVQAAITEGRAALERRDGVAAEMALRRALDAGAARPQLAALLGQAYYLQGDNVAAREWLGPGDFAPAERRHGFHMLALLEMAEGNLPASGEAFDKALEGNDGTAAIWVDIGRLRFRGNEHHQALAASIEALRLDPKNPQALEFRGQLARDGEGLVAALPWFEKGLEASPDDLSLLGEYAATLGEMGRAKDMLRTTRRMIELDAGSSRAFYLQSVMAARAGNYLLARRLLWRAGDDVKGGPAGLMLQGVLELESGNHALAAEVFVKLVRLQPENERARLLFMRALLANGEAREVIARYRTLADRADASPYLLTLIGRSFEALGDRASAAPYLDRALVLPTPRNTALAVSEAGELAIFRWGSDPYRLDAVVPAVRQLLAAGQGAEAAGMVMRLAALYGGSVDVQILSGDVALVRGDMERALNDYQTAAIVRRTLPLTRRMAVALQLLGRDAEARAVISEYLAQHPQDAGAAELLGKLVFQSGDVRRGRLLLNHALNIRQGGGRDPFLFNSLALADIELGENDKALANAEAAFRMQRANAGTARILSRILLSAGRKAEADALATKAARQARPLDNPV